MFNGTVHPLLRACDQIESGIPLWKQLLPKPSSVSDHPMDAEGKRAAAAL